MRKYKEETVTIKRHKLIRVVCDRCGKTIKRDITKDIWHQLERPRIMWNGDDTNPETYDLCSKCYVWFEKALKSKRRKK